MLWIVNLGKWLLRNIFLGFIREQQRVVARRTRETSQESSHRVHRTSAPTHIDTQRGHSPESPRHSSSSGSRSTLPAPRSASIVTSPTMVPAVIPSVNWSAKSSPLLTPMIPVGMNRQRDSLLLSPIPQSPGSDATPLARPQRSHTTDGSMSSGRTDNDYFSMRTRQPTNMTTPDTSDFSGWNAKSTPATDTPASSTATPASSAGTGTTGFMGRFKVFGKGSSKRHTSEFGSSGTGSTQADASATPSVSLLFHMFDHLCDTYVSVA